MPVRDLAPALLALSELFAEAASSIYPEREPVTLDVRATQSGSFIVDLVLEAPRTWNQIVSTFTSDDATALVNLQNLIIGSATGGVGLFKLIKLLHGKRVESREPGPEAGVVRLNIDSESSIEVPVEVLRLHESIRIRKRARAVVGPLSASGVDRLEFWSAAEVTVAIDASDYEAFDVLEEPVADQESAREFEMVLSIASIAFVEGNKWRFSDGERSFYATIRDEAFLARVEHGEPFRKGDMLRSRVRVLQTRDAEGLHTEWELVEVLEHIPRTIQPPLG